MPYVRTLRFVTFIALIFALVSRAAFAAGPRPADEVFKLSVQLDEETGIELNWSIAPGHYLYRERIGATRDGKPLKMTLSRGDMKDDPTFGLTEVYHGMATATVAMEDLPKSGTIQVTYQGCAENILCYPPITKAIDLETLAVTDPSEAEHNGVSTRPVEYESAGAVPMAAQPETGGESGTASISLDGGYIPMIAAFFGFGLLLSFTPCVFPMVPILSGMLARTGGGLSMGRSLVLSGTYVLAMAAAYGMLGAFAAWSGENLQAVLQTPWAILLMSLIFVVLALSMFGLFELQLPQSWTTRLAGAAGNRGSVSGAGLLGFGSALIVGPCVTPPLAAALIYVAQTGNVLRGSSALFALGVGMGIPLLAFGILGAKVLPRSGPWLAHVKSAFGFIFIGLAIWMASRVLPIAAVAAAWGALFIAIGFALGALNIFKSRWTTPRMAFRTAGVIAMLYGCVLLVGAASARYQTLRPLDAVGLVTRPQVAGADNSHFQTVSSEAELDRAIAVASKQGRMIMVDFSAEWCVECKVMERNVLSVPAVLQELHNVVLIRADVTRVDQSSKKLMQRFDVVGPPTIVFLDPEGSEISNARVIGAVGVNAFLAQVAKALRA
ncbi:protein-disulfide reductase DsbD [Bradyrhizobium sp. SYSU BS000235]|uniref:protein-disulfide reductase DsbD n=1 Tax=Bradyrhizobium sp. SYSU BS000235 TaxID=3411332 RepID=UPI003C770D48